MELTLRAAHKLVDKIDAQIRTIDLNAIVLVNAFDVDRAADQVTNLFIERAAEFDNRLLRVDNLITIRTDVREQIRTQNDVSGIGSVISQRKDKLDRIAMYTRVFASSHHEQMVSTAVALQRQIARVQDAKELHSETVHFSLINSEARVRVEQYVATVKRAVEALEDRLLYLNINTKIMLSTDHVETLKEENLI